MVHSHLPLAVSAVLSCLAVAACAAQGGSAEEAAPSEQDLTRSSVAHDQKALLGTYRVAAADANKAGAFRLLSLHPGDGQKVNGQGPYFHLEIFDPSACAGEKDCDPVQEVESDWLLRASKKTGALTLTLEDEDGGDVGTYTYRIDGDTLHVHQLVKKDAAPLDFDMTRVKDACGAAGGSCVARGPLTDNPPGCAGPKLGMTSSYTCDGEDAVGAAKTVCCAPR